MMNFLWFYMIMFPGGVCCLSFTSIGSTNGDNIFECNANVTLVCKTEKGQDNIVFKINDIQAANCVHGCYVNTPILGNYTLSHDYDAGVIRLDIHKVSVADASNTFTCEGDSTTISIKPVIKVFPERSSTKIIIKETSSTNLVEIKALTGCVLLQTNLTFVWNKTRTSNGTFLEPLSEEDFISISHVSEEYSNCISLDHCGGTVRSNTLTFREERSGIYYFITCTISIDKNDTGNFTETYTVFSERSFVFKEEIPCNKWWCLPCWVFGVILAGLTLATFLITILTKVKCSEKKVGLLRWWELSAIVGLCAMVIYLLIIIVVAGVCKDCNSTKRRQFDCWIIYIILLGILVACDLVCILVYIAKERVSGLKVVSRSSNGKRMAIKLEWTSRLHKYKTFYMVLNNENDSRELDYTLRKDGVMEFELTDLKLDSDYVACLYSTMCIMQSSKYRIEFNTKSRPLPPYEVCEDETVRTESSVTLIWQPAKGPKHHFIIKYQRSKGKNRNWMYTEKINATKYTIDGLKPNTSYTLIINAENESGSSEDSEPLYVNTRALKPIPPEDFRCISIKESEVILSWKPSGKIQKQEFILTINNMSEESKPGTKPQDTEISIPNTGKKVVTHKVTDLKPGSKYLFELFSAAGKLMSERSAITSVETEGDAIGSIHDGDVDDGVPSKNKGSNVSTVFHVTHN